jgi:hypothetical protein
MITLIELYLLNKYNTNYSNLYYNLYLHSFIREINYSVFVFIVLLIMLAELGVFEWFLLVKKPVTAFWKFGATFNLFPKTEV